MKNKYMLSILTAGLILTGCNKENPFDGENSAEGKLYKSSLDMSVTDNNIQVNMPTRAGGYNLNDFQVSFIKDGSSIATKTYTYGEMPEVVTLPVGLYTAKAILGEDREAEWENPYFVGTSSQFEVSAYEITSYIDPIECELHNVKATIEFAPSLANVMSADSYVEVKVGSNSGLNFTKAESDNGKAGYFRHTDETTLVATFHGSIDGARVVETKTYTGVAKGRWYKLTFKLHEGSGDSSGDIEGGVVIDGSVNVIDVNADVNVGDDEPLDDSGRPEWNPGGGGDDPEPNTGEAPEFVAVTPGLVFDTPYHVTGDSSCEFKIVSTAEGGFTEMTCDIISPDLTPEELAGFGIPAHLDLVNTPADVAETLGGLGFPVNVGGEKSVIFNLSPFMNLMVVFGNHQHEFKIAVTDANGTTVKSLILQF